MSVVATYNNLDGVKTSRKELEKLLSRAKKEHSSEVVHRLTKILDNYPSFKYFKINIKSKIKEDKGLGNPRFNDLQEARKHYLDWAKKELIGKDLGLRILNKQIIFTSDGVRHALKKYATFSRVRIIERIKDLINNAKIVSVSEDKNKDKNVLNVYHLKSVIKFDNKDEIVNIILKEKKNGLHYYDHYLDSEIVKNKKYTVTVQGNHLVTLHLPVLKRMATR